MPAPTANPWEEMELDENGWNTLPTANLQVEPTAPYFIGVPQVPQIPTLYAPSNPSSPNPDQQPVSIPELGCRSHRTNQWR